MLIQKHKLELTARIQACIDPYRSRHRKYHLRYLVRCAKKVVSDSPGLVDFAIGLVIFPDGQVLFFWGNSNYRRMVISLANQKGFGG